MTPKSLTCLSLLTLSFTSIATVIAQAEVFKLEPIEVNAPPVHPSQQLRHQVEGAFDQTRSTSSVDGSVIQNLNPVNNLDSVRYNATGVINAPFNGDRFGGGTSIRTFGDWGAARSIDGLPAFKTAGEEGGGYSNSVVPAIAIEQINVVKGGRAVQYGDGTDGGVMETRVKSGRHYKDHLAGSLDLSTAGDGEGVLQAEIANGEKQWDYYAAGSWMEGRYDREPPNLDRQRILNGVTKIGFNPSDATRVELLGLIERSRPDIIRNNNLEEITVDAVIGGLTMDSKIDPRTSIRMGHLYADSRSLWDARNRDRSLENFITFADGFYTAPLSSSITYNGSAGLQHKRTNLLRDNQWDNTFNDISAKWINAVTFDKNLTLTLGLRQTWFNNDITLNGQSQPDNLQSDSVTSYEAGAAYNVTESTRLRTSVATGYNRFFEKYGNFGTDALNTLGAGDEVVESLSLEVGGRYSWLDGYFDAAVYNIEQENVPRRNGGAIESVSVDQTGLELELASRLTDRLTMSAGYMHIFDVEATRADGTKAGTNIFFDGSAASVPKNQTSVRLDFRATETWSFWGMAHHSTGYEAITADGTVQKRDAFVRADIGAAWRVTPKAVLRARIENLLDEKDFGATLEGIPVNDSGKIGRVFWVGLDYTF
jgi:outer membrane receptor protein involved in Fe transport